MASPGEEARKVVQRRKTELELRSIIWRFTRARSRRKRDWPAKPSIPFPRPKSRGEGSPLFLLSSPSPCYKQSITTIEILSAEYSYGCFIVFFSFISSDNLLSPLGNFAKFSSAQEEYFWCTDIRLDKILLHRVETSIAINHEFVFRVSRSFELFQR